MGLEFVVSDAFAHRAVSGLARERSRYLPETVVAGPRCGSCGRPMGSTGTAVKRGAIVVLRNPIRVLWRRHYVPLSPAESAVFAAIAIPGRATFAEIDDAMKAAGAKTANRAVVLYRIRRKFLALGSKTPFERRPHGLAIAMEADEDNSIAVVIGLPEAGYKGIG